MTSTFHTRLLAFVLTAIALTIFGIKVFQYNYPLTPGTQTTTWDFEIYLDFDTANQPVRIETFVPSNSDTRRVSQEQYYNGAFGLRLETDDDNGRKAIEWGVYGMPETFVVNGKGEIVYKHVGAITPASMTERLIPAIEKAKANPKVGSAVN